MRYRWERKKNNAWMFGLMYMGFFVWVGVVGIATVHGAEIVDRIVAVVNDDIITLNDLDHALKPYMSQIKSMGYTAETGSDVPAKLRKDILNRLIDQKLTDQEIKKARLAVSEAEVDSAVERIKEKNLYSDADFRKALAEEGLSLEEFRKNMKEQILRSRLVNREVKSKIVVTEQDVKAYYEAHSEEFGREQTYHLRNIIMRLPRMAGEAEKQDALKRMAGVLEKLNNGESFEHLARQYSESNLSAEGGDLGFFKLEALSPQLQEALKDLDAGNFTPVIETDQGFQIFYIQEIRKAPGKPLTEVAAEIQEKLYNEIVEKKFNQWLGELRNRSHIKVIE
ncbi:MAG: SurA N-terminal domain-containing protein [Desulfobacterales bacterium]|nr:SurA N-terminal domain-containing protein [Desulfobacterales bacterium]